ncbi:D-lactate dehydrogenase [Flavobacteriaceae bacterium]|jgi:D-lactate dehydrogenase|nr:D-lactate dehydrogenase [Flavobacteriaceae bacterium]|tara:strand:- start:3651 stop:5342 length:1692 start_codon:yes stop_codon:yes gene_type:complete
MNFKSRLINDLKAITGDKHILTAKWSKQQYSKGWRYGEGEALAVAKPGALLEIWQILQICVKADIIVIMQAANTGLTGGSTPDGNDYDRPIVIISTMRINEIQIINEGKQIIGFSGSTLFGLENKLAPYGREPHSVIGSSCIGASIVGGVCNNSGGALVKRGPAYTELSIYAQINLEGELVLVNDLGIKLGETPEEILNNLQTNNYTKDQVQFPDKLASDNEYQKRVRDVDASTPARYNADARRLHGASGCAGKIAVFAVRLDTYPIPKRQQVFYVGTNSSYVLGKIRRDILSKFQNLPTSGEYLHRDCYDAAKKYSKDTFVAIDKMGPSFIPKLFEIKRKVDLLSEKLKFLPDNFSDRLMQFLSNFWPNHLPKRMEQYRDQYEHHWVIEMSEDGIDEANTYFKKFFKENEGSFFKCTEVEAKKAILHRFVAASAVGRYHVLNKKKSGAMMSMDIAFPRNEKDWFEKLPPEIDDLLEMKLYYGHLFCHVLHQNYIVKKGVDAEKLKEKLLKTFDTRGAEYPAEHNVGHEYFAKPTLSNFYKKLDPTNGFNPGIGRTSKLKYWK